MIPSETELDPRAEAADLPQGKGRNDAAIFNGVHDAYTVPSPSLDTGAIDRVKSEEEKELEAKLGAEKEGTILRPPGVAGPAQPPAKASAPAEKGTK